MEKQIPSVVFSNYEEYECWYNQHISAAWEKAGFPTHLHRGDVKIPASASVEKELLTKFVTETLKLNIVCTEDVDRTTHEEFYIVAVSEEIVFSASLNESLYYRSYTNSAEKAKEIADAVNNTFIFEKKAEGKFKFAFWQMDEGGCRIQYSRLGCPSLDEIRDNYNKETFEEVHRILDLENPYQHGKIVLWHGPPGNGKTYLIRSAARHWIEKHNIVPEVIIDPQELFAFPSYLTTLLLRRSAKKDQPFRLFIAEDCAQLFTTEGRGKEGFDRLLNIADGLLGQDQKIIFLFTANEKIEDIDPAILRPGRCLQNVLIDDWNVEAAHNWLKEHDIYDEHADNVTEKVSLASLYAMLNGVIPAKQHKNENFGFKMQ